MVQTPLVASQPRSVLGMAKSMVSIVPLPKLASWMAALSVHASVRPLEVESHTPSPNFTSAWSSVELTTNVVVAAWRTAPG